MQRLEDAVTHMQQSLSKLNGLKMEYLVGNESEIIHSVQMPALVPFSDRLLDFLNELSKTLMADKRAKEYADVITFAFWIRRASINAMRKRLTNQSDSICLGRGLVFHIAPSNVPVNYAYSLVTGLICGNRNIVRVPSKKFEQVEIINNAINHVLLSYDELKPYIVLVRYGHDKEINDALSSICDVRVVWGGDITINELRKSPMKPRATEIVFADRYSLAVIDSDMYMEYYDKEILAQNFYNDTYLTDQNACTSPRLLVWLGSQKNEAKEEFWGRLHSLVEKKYDLSGVQAVNKLTSSLIVASKMNDIKKVPSEDNLIVRVKVSSLEATLMEYKDNSGYFYEYDCDDIMEMVEICNDDRCQTISYFADKKIFISLLYSGICGIDRVVPIGATMDFDLIWDGYNLFDRLTRLIKI